MTPIKSQKKMAKISSTLTVTTLERHSRHYTGVLNVDLLKHSASCSTDLQCNVTITRYRLKSNSC